ncbi:MAG: hypothetical protein FJX72_17875 [Armatimonadetes bacterium]|nr:hypothetical protein [Armatimonadota bacterium]
MARRLLTLFSLATLCAGLVVAVMAYEEDCVSCGGGNQNSYCCTCEECAGHDDECMGCAWGTAEVKCKWHDGNGYVGCCTYTKRPMRYESTGEGEGGCPCGTSTVGECGSTWHTAIYNVTWHSNLACWSSSKGSPDIEYGSPPYQCLSQAPGGGGGS